MKYLFWAGDSTVKHNRVDTYPQTGMGQMISRYLKSEVVVRNHAENGRSTKSFIDEGRLKKMEDEFVSKAIVLIEFGHNDEKEDKERHTEPFGSFQDNLNQFIDAAYAANAYPVLVTPLSRRIFNKEGVLENTHGEYPKAMKELAKKRNVALIDLCEKSKEVLQKTGDAASLKWFMHIQAGEYPNYKEELKDNTHLKYEGALIMAGLVAEGLKELGGRYAELVA